MDAYRTPGIYFEWLNESRRRVLPWRTDIAGFVGIAERGPLHTKVELESWAQFTSIFGRHMRRAHLAYAVEGFFANGGATCYVVRVADPDAAKPACVEVATADGWPLLRLVARSEGTWAHALTVSATTIGSGHYSLTLRLPSGEEERWINLALAPAEGYQRDAIRALNDPAAGSRLVKAEKPEGFGAHGPAVRIGGPPGRLHGGADGLSTLRLAHLSGEGAPPGAIWGLAALEPEDAVSIVAMPDAAPAPPRELAWTARPAPDCRTALPDGEAPSPPLLVGPPAGEAPPAWSPEETSRLQLALLRHCERLKDRLAILDPYGEDLAPQQIWEWREQFDTSYGALYYPWLVVQDRLGAPGDGLAVPPCGHVAGIYARTDRSRGVHKAPANEELVGVLDIAPASLRPRSGAALAPSSFGRPAAERRGGLPPIDDLTHADLNDAQVNVIRPYPGRGVRVAGARTLSREQAWRYVNVRRLVTMIEEAIDELTQWTVHEPIEPRLWRAVDRVISGFLRGLWRRGMLDGATAELAYSVRCDEILNPPVVQALGRVVCEVGLRPPWPAEFVIVRIGKTEGAAEIVERTGEYT